MNCYLPSCRIWYYLRPGILSACQQERCRVPSSGKKICNAKTHWTWKIVPASLLHFRNFHSSFTHFCLFCALLLFNRIPTESPKLSLLVRDINALVDDRFG